jgi:hypothetical protein
MMAWQCREAVMGIPRLGILEDLLDCPLYLRSDPFAGTGLVGSERDAEIIIGMDLL